MNGRTFGIVLIAVLLAAAVVPTNVLAEDVGPGADLKDVEEAELASESMLVLQQSEPNTSDEYLSAFQSLQGEPAFSAYNELEVIRTQAAVEVQTGSFERPKRNQMELVLRFLERFRTAYDAAEAGDQAKAFARANETAATLNRLAETQAGSYAVLGRVALDRFYRQMGARTIESANKTTYKPEKIALIRRGASAYRRGGAQAEAAVHAARAEMMTSTYRDDLAEINESTAIATKFHENCGQSCTSPIALVRTHGLGVFNLYQSARETNRRVAVAINLADQHSLADRLDRLRSLKQRSSAVVLVSAGGCALVAGSYHLAPACAVVQGQTFRSRSFSAQSNANREGVR